MYREAGISSGGRASLQDLGVQVQALEELPRPLNVAPLWDPNHKIGHPIKGTAFKGLGTVKDKTNE